MASQTKDTATETTRADSAVYFEIVDKTAQKAGSEGSREMCCC